MKHEAEANRDEVPRETRHGGAGIPTVHGEEHVEHPGEIVDVLGHPLHVIADATGEPPLLLTSGLGGAWYDWSPLMPHLPGGRQVVRFDRPGLGRSPRDQQVPTLACETERLAALIERFSGTGAVVVAHSLAGLHAEALARRFPASVRGLVLVDASNGPSAPGPGGDATPRRVPLSSTPARPRRSVARAAWALAAAADRGRVSPHVGPPAFTAALRLLTRGPVPDEVLTAGRRAFTSAVPAAATWCELLAYRKTVLDLAALRSHPFPPIPVHVLTAIGDLSRNAGRHWLDRQQRLAVELGARHRVMAEAGHFLAWQRPDAVAAAIEDVGRRER